MFGYSQYQSDSGFDPFSRINLESPQISSPPFPNSHLSSPSPDLEGINLNDSFNDVVVENVGNLPSTVRVNYTDEETICLTCSWVDLSADAITGNSQKEMAYWGKVVACYHQIILDSRRRREKPALKNHWQRVATQVKKFHGYYSNHEKMWQSGLSDRDIMNCAHMEYKQNEGKIFQLVPVWEILKSCPKFWEVEAGSESSVPTDVEASRPIGNKRAIAERKGKKKEHAPTANENLVEKMDILT